MTLSYATLSIRVLLMLRFFLVFVVVLLVLFGLEVLEPIDRHVIVPFTSTIADISAWLMRGFDADVFVQGKIIGSQRSGFAVSVERGCNGVEAVIILTAAILAFPAPWKHKLAGIGAGFFAVQAVNLVRIVSLFYLGQWNRVWFDWFHLYFWQALIVLDALAVFLVWLRMLPRPAACAADAAP